MSVDVRECWRKKSLVSCNLINCDLIFPSTRLLLIPKGESFQQQAGGAETGINRAAMTVMEPRRRGTNARPTCTAQCNGHPVAGAIHPDEMNLLNVPSDRSGT